MTTSKSVLVGIDFSTTCIHALKKTAQLAETRNLRVICFHILDGEVLKDFYKNISFDTDEILETAREKLAGFIAENVGEEHQFEMVVKIGNPFAEILEMIKEYSPLALILGSHGQKTPYFEQVGALAARCVRKAPVEVLLVRDGQDAPFQRIGACVDFSETSIHAAHRAAEIAMRDGAALQLLHVFQPASYKDSGMGWLGAKFSKVDEDEVKKEKEQELKALRDELLEKYQLENISLVVEEAPNVAKGLFQILKNMDADLVVLGTRGRTGLKGFFLGTTAESLIQTTPCSTLAVKPKEFLQG